MVLIVSSRYNVSRGNVYAVSFDVLFLFDIHFESFKNLFSER